MPKTSPASDRRYRVTLGVIAAGLVAMQAASMTGLRTRLWGTHVFAFLPLAVALVAWAALAAAAFLWLRRRESGDAPAAPTESIRTTLLLATGLTVACTLLFWFVRSRQTLLGDAVPLMIDLPRGKAFHPRQPFAMWIQQQLYQHVGGWFQGEGVSDQDVAGNAVAVGSVAAGAVFVAIAVALGRALVRGTEARRATPWLCALLLIAQGYIVLVFGYIENYSYYLVMVALYLLCALLYLDRRAPLALVAAVFVVSLGVHLSSIALAPSLGFLVVVALRDRGRRTDGVVGVVALVAGLFAIDRVFAHMSPGFRLWSAIADITRIARTSQGGGAGLSYMFSARHINDFVAEMSLVGPVATWLLFPTAVFGVLDGRLRRNPAAVFLLIASACYLGGNWAASEPLLGYARDWDLFAPAGVCYAATAFFVVVHQTAPVRGRDRHGRQRLLAFALVLSLAQVAPWLWINHVEERSIARFATLPLGGGRTESALGNHYFRKGDNATAERWFRRALAIDPTNPNANSLLGRLYALQGNFDLSAEYLRRSVAVRPDKATLRRDYALVLIQSKHCREALPQLLWLVQRQPDDLNYWHRIGDSMVLAGCTDELAQVYAPLLDWLDRYAAAKPTDPTAEVHAGMMLDRLGRTAEAADKFRQALSVAPKDAMALYGLGVTLGKLGQTDASHREYRRFLELYPNHDLAGAARKALEQ